MRIIIAGTRNYENYEEAKKFINSVLASIAANKSVTILSGGCKGSDSLGERYAKEHGLHIEMHKADWARYQKAAGPLRNRKMIMDSDAVICFWDQKSRGTKSLIEFAKKYNKKVYLKTI